ncbi:MAG: beta-ketoacyl-ACP synthase III [Eubacteriales bacterium]
MKIRQTARFLPEKIVTNDDFAKTIDTNDQWILSRTGISQRRFATESNTEMAVSVGKSLLEKSKISPEDISCVMVASFTPDNMTPSMACLVQKALGLPTSTMAFDFNAACSGFVYGLWLAQQMINNNAKGNIMLIGSEKITSHLDFTDRNTCILFGDGAAGAILSSGGPDFPFTFGTKGDDQAICCPVGGKISMAGKEVFVFAVNAISESLEEILSQTGLSTEDIDHVVCHQANLRIISHVYKKLAIPAEKFYINLDRYGNTSSASIPIVLDEMAEKNLLNRGDKVLCVGFGAGLTWGATLVTW